MKRMGMLVAAVLAAAAAAEARVKLVSLPERARTVVSLAHPDATLMEEERILTLQKGVNRVDFAWQGVNLDPASIQIRPLDHPDAVRVLNTSYPPGEQALVWELSSPAAQEERVRISYLVEGLKRDTVYKAVAAADERTLALRTYLRLDNRTGEDFTGAEFIAGGGVPLTRSLEDGEIVELLLDKAEGVAVRKELRWDAAAMPWDPEFTAETPGLPLGYVLVNGREQGLGRATLREGKARLFLATRERRDDGGEDGEGAAFLGEDWLPLTPVDREARLNLGQSRDVKVTLRKMRDDRTNIRRDAENRDVIWDTDEEFKAEVQNFKKEPVQLVLVQQVPGYWQMFSYSHPYRKRDAFTIEFPLTLRPEAKETVTFRLHRLNVQGKAEPTTYRGGPR